MVVPEIRRGVATFLSVEELVAVFADYGIDITDEAATELHRHTLGWRALVEAAAVVHSPGESCTNPAAGIRAANREMRDLIPTVVDESWGLLLRYLAVAGRSSLRELDVRDDGDALTDVLAARLAAPETVHGEACVTLMPALAAAFVERVPTLEALSIRRLAADLRRTLGVLDRGLSTAREIGDLRLCAAILEEIPFADAATSYADLCRDVLMNLPVELARDFPSVGHRMEIWGRIPVGTVPVAFPARSDDVVAACLNGEALRIMDRTLYAMAARRESDLPDAAEIARSAARVVRQGLQIDSAAVRGQAAVWFLHAGISTQLAGYDDEARRFYRMGWEHRLTDRTGFAAKDLASKLALVAGDDGDLDQTLSWLREYDAAPLAADAASVRESVEHNAELARHTLAVDQLDADAVEDWAVLGPPAPAEGYWAFVIWVRARWAITTGRPELVADLVSDGHLANPRSAAAPGLHVDQLAEVAAEARMAQGQAVEALAILQGVSTESVHCRPARARLRLLSGHPTDAAVMAIDYRARRDTRLRDVAELELIEAEAHLRSGDRRAALAAAALALRSADRRRDLRVWATVPREFLLDLAAEIPQLADRAAELDRRGITPIYPSRLVLIDLSHRESIVLRELAAGDTLERIAANLFVSLNTIKSQVRSLYHKLGATSRAEAVATARRLGLLRDS